MNRCDVLWNSVVSNFYFEHYHNSITYSININIINAKVSVDICGRTKQASQSVKQRCSIHLII